MYSGAHRGSVEDRSRQGPSHDTWHALKKKEKKKNTRKEYERGGSFCCWTASRAGDEVCLHPCRIHQRVFEQTDSRRTPLSAINQQHTHTPLFYPSLPLSSSPSRREEEERTDDCAQRKTWFIVGKVLKCSRAHLKEEVVFIYSDRYCVLFFFVVKMSKVATPIHIGHVFLFF